MPSLHFKGKPFVQNHHLVVPFHELAPVKSKGTSAKPSLHDNLVVEGDNLKALKALLPTYHGKVKCIYIDPPYNTGNEEWRYNDAVNSPMMQEWFGREVDREDLTRHDKWCCMMLPRLKLLRELLTDDGAIFVSIDDNEVHRLRCLMDEVFGEENFVVQIEWQKRYTRSNNTDNFTTVLEHLVAYRRTDAFAPNLAERSAEADARYENADEDERGPWKSIPFLNPLSAAERPNLAYAITQPNTGKKLRPKAHEKAWRASEDVFLRYTAEKRVWWGADGLSETPNIKRFLSEVRQGMTPINFWDYKFAGSTDDAAAEINQIFGEKVFSTPKPSQLLQRVIEVTADKDSIVMDSFAGSGTTAHAVLALNKQDGGNRRFILVECEDYADSITAERVRRVAQGVPGAKDEALRAGLGGTFSYFKLGRPMELHSILAGKSLPDFESLARYVFFTATGEEFDAKKIDRKSGFIGESRHHDVFLFYTEDPAKLRNLALTLDAARALPSVSGKPKLVFAPTKYLDEHFLDRLRIQFCQLPFQIYRALDA